MIRWIKEISWKKVFMIGIIYTVASVIVRQVEAMLTMKYYLMPQYSGVWSKLMMPARYASASAAGGPVYGPPPFEFMVTSFIFTLASGISITLIYYYLKDFLPKGFWKRVFFFADVLIATSFVFFTLPVYLLFNVPLGLLFSWFISSFILVVFGSFLIVKIVGKS
jgi:hypothetical protein